MLGRSRSGSSESRSRSDSSESRNRRIHVMANRLPVSLTKSENQWTFRMSSGGLVSAMGAIKDMNMTWIGWPGCEVPVEEQQQVSDTLWAQYRAIPVFLSAETADLYYNGFANGVLWPLFHSINPTLERDVDREEQQWNAYVQANLEFAQVFTQHAEPSDLVWVQDYHLMLVPKFIRELLKEKSPPIGWFLHTPFPSYELYRTLSYREQILEGVLCANLLGFHIADYLRHFQMACTHILGLPSSNAGVESLGEFSFYSRTQVFPIGIDPEIFRDYLDQPEVLRLMDDFECNWQDKKLILGVDRLDYIKGIPHKLLAFEILLQKHPEWIGKVVLVQLAVPSRTDVLDYQVLKAQTHEIVGRINSTCGLLGYTPVHYLDQSVNQKQLTALYRRADVCFVSSLRDGMNLVAFEYTSCQYERCGVLLLSEFAGCAKTLGAGAIVINPWDLDETAEALNDALNMEIDERVNRFEHNYNYVKNETAQRWAQQFITALEEAAKRSSEESHHIPKILNFRSFEDCDENTRSIVNAFQKCKQAMIVLEEVGVLDPTSTSAFIDYGIDPTAAKFINALAEDQSNVVLVMTSKRFEDSRLGCLTNPRITLAVESGNKYKTVGESEWQTVLPSEEMTWMPGVMEIMKFFHDCTPGATLYLTSVTVEWSYRNVHYEFGMAQSRKLLAQLRAGPVKNNPADAVVTSSTELQVRDTRTSKAKFLEQFLRKNHNEEGLILCMGNPNWKDEKEIGLLLQSLQGGQKDFSPQQCFFLRVGKLQGFSQFAFKEHFDGMRFLDGLSRVSKTQRRMSV